MMPRFMGDWLRQVEEKGSPKKLLLPALAFSYFSTGPLGVLVSLLLVDIGLTFNADVSLTSQTNTAYAVAASVFALLMGVLSVRFRQKTLLVIGLLLASVSALGFYLAWDFAVVLAAYSLSGIGFAMISPTVFTLIGEHIGIDKRANAIGLTVAAGALGYVIGPPLIAWIAGFGGWRLCIVGFVVPASFLSLLIALVGVPVASSNDRKSQDWRDCFGAFRSVLSNKSAVACVIGDALRSAAFVATLVYVASFIREHFQMSTDFASFIMLGGASSYTVGSLVAGPFVKKLGRKRLTVLNAFLAGTFTVCYYVTPDLWLSMALVMAASWFFGMLASSASSLVLEQVPEARGTTMSLSTASVSLGSALGTAVGGLTLSSYGYAGLGTVLGAVGLAAAFVYLLLVREPVSTKTQVRT
jgi:predicted MFS family arabinose efflux permease